VNYIWSLTAQVWGGTTAAIISNFMIFSVWYIAKYSKSLDILGNLVFVNIVANIPGLIANLVYFAALLSPTNGGYYAFVSDMIYYYTRLISIFINFLLFAHIYYTVSRTSSRRLKSTPSDVERAITTLVNRLKYYPIIQAISRLGYSWYFSFVAFLFAVDLN
jgi:hypothetical protein